LKNYDGYDVSRIERHVLPRWFSFVNKFQAYQSGFSNRHMVIKPLSPCPLGEFSESLSLCYKWSKSWKKAQKEQLNLTFSEDLTAVSLIWTIFQTKPTTNDYLHYILFS